MEGTQGLQKDDMIREMKMRTVAIQLHLQAMKEFDFYKSLKTREDHEVGINNSLSKSDKHTSLGEQVSASIVQTNKFCKLDDTREGGEESVMSTQEYIRKDIEDVCEDDDFTRATWLSVLDYVNVDGWIVTGCFGDVKKFLKNGKLDKVVSSSLVLQVRMEIS
uniref:Uncharacterized protein n=1 Tax=Tanacetum cinerariifolium TaxID=118510 RepID=A0A699KSB6_TANCI|nr:hypothetical protein [Tanacetum cinerariifolium]